MGDSSLIARSSLTLNASLSNVWNALINPAMIKQYLFETEVTSDWKEGSPITYRGVWQGKTYEDKGTILKIIPEKLMVSTYWSSMSGTADIPQNYNTVTYQLEPTDNGKVTLSISQDNIATEESKKHSEENWRMVLENLKKLLEKTD